MSQYFSLSSRLECAVSIRDRLRLGNVVDRPNLGILFLFFMVSCLANLDGFLFRFHLNSLNKSRVEVRCRIISQTPGGLEELSGYLFKKEIILNVCVFD